MGVIFVWFHPSALTKKKFYKDVWRFTQVIACAADGRIDGQTNRYSEFNSFVHPDHFTSAMADTLLRCRRLANCIPFIRYGMRRFPRADTFKIKVLCVPRKLDGLQSRHNCGLSVLWGAGAVDHKLPLFSTSPWCPSDRATDLKTKVSNNNNKTNTYVNENSKGLRNGAELRTRKQVKH